VARGRLLARAPLSSLAEPVCITVFEEIAEGLAAGAGSEAGRASP
jgi:hypothetical protein